MSVNDPSPASAAEIRTVTVDIDGRPYAIHIGPRLLPRAGALIGALAPRAKCVIVTDETVARLHLAPLTTGLAAAGVAAVPDIVLPAGEASKSFDHLRALCDRLLDLEIERGDVVIALGGGVIGDLAGFAASIVRRGVRLVQIPTTLLAQVDSAIGGKTGINTSHGKNLIGSFHQPSLVLADTDALTTLPAREFRAGYAEVAKYGLLGDAAFFAWLEDNWRGVFGAEAPARAYAIETSCRAKAAVVAEDEREAGRRALLNLGHTFGHALEAWAGYGGDLLHGEAVAIGMVLAFELSQELGLCPPGTPARVAAHLAAVGLPTRITDAARAHGGAPPSPDALIRHMLQDKKVRAGRPAFVLVHGIGAAFVCDAVEPERLRRFLMDKCNPQ